MEEGKIPDELVVRGVGSRIVFVVLDGVGGLPHPDTGLTELESARTPVLDSLAAGSSLGMHTPVAPGITPGSGPGHLALFGYDPFRYEIGRGALSALGVGFELRPGDLAIRLNFATLDAEGSVTDRRAGRPSDEEGRRIVARLAEVPETPGVERFLLHEKEHRAVLVFRGDGLSDALSDTDPQRTGVPPVECEPRAAEGARSARILNDFLAGARDLLRGEPAISGLLARGFARYEALPGFEARYGLRGAAWARYPMYRGVARLVGMEVPGVPSSDEEAVSLLEANFGAYDFHFLHCKAPDARGEDGDFAAKVAAIETADAWMARVAALEPDVLVVTGDHSTPATVGAHSWHAVPVLLHSRWARPTGAAFCENNARLGDLGHFEGRHLMTLALAHAGRLAKYGA